jgi:hypothetical protein
MSQKNAEKILNDYAIVTLHAKSYRKKVNDYSIVTELPLFSTLYDQQINATQGIFYF